MLYFVDESGIDLKESPFLVLGAVGLAESQTWAFSREFAELERTVLRVADPGEYEIKGSKLLTRRVFRQATRLDAIANAERDQAIDRLYAKNVRGENPSELELTALAQAKIAFVDSALDLAKAHGANVFASMVPRDAPRQTDETILRKDFAYLFQRIHCDVVDRAKDEQGILLFDELDPALSKRLLVQMRKYFIETANGMLRGDRLLPLPFFVRSDLTPPIELADLVAYILNWGFRMDRMPEPAREELVPLATKVFSLRYSGREAIFRTRRRESRPSLSSRRGRQIWGISYIPDLRPRSELITVTGDEEDLDTAHEKSAK
jgi:hypothetical protein